jgi:carboxyl-terminal processing protease
MLGRIDPYTEYIPEENSDDFRMLTTGAIRWNRCIDRNEKGI